MYIPPYYRICCNSWHESRFFPEFGQKCGLRALPFLMCLCRDSLFMSFSPLVALALKRVDVWQVVDHNLASE